MKDAILRLESEGLVRTEARRGVFVLFSARQALEMAPTHTPDFERYVYWFLQLQAINATRPEAGARILAEMRKGGWPI